MRRAFVGLIRLAPTLTTAQEKSPEQAGAMLALLRQG